MEEINIMLLLGIFLNIDLYQDICSCVKSRVMLKQNHNIQMTFPQSISHQIF